MDSMWRKIWSFDRPPKTGGGRYMMVFIGESIYFILALCGDYEEAVFMADFASVMTMSLLSFYMLSFVVIEGDHWRPVYQKIMYFPIDRKKYLLAKAVPGAAAIGFQVGITWLIFLCRIPMDQGVALEVMLLLTACMVVSGIWYFFSLLGLMVLGERAVNLFPIPFILGVCGVHMICRVAQRM